MPWRFILSDHDNHDKFKADNPNSHVNCDSTFSFDPQVKKQAFKMNKVSSFLLIVGINKLWQRRGESQCSIFCKVNGLTLVWQLFAINLTVWAYSDDESVNETLSSPLSRLSFRNLSFCPDHYSFTARNVVNHETAKSKIWTRPTLKPGPRHEFDPADSRIH